MKRIIFFTGVYDTLDLFAYELKREFEAMEFETMIFDVNCMGESLGRLSRFMEKPVAAAITFNNLGFNMELHPGKNFNGSSVLLSCGIGGGAKKCSGSLYRQKSHELHPPFLSFYSGCRLSASRRSRNGRTEKTHKGKKHRRFICRRPFQILCRKNNSRFVRLYRF